ncbi:peptidoglycan editing factor PgeF [Alteriqipengyuania lutimaris]|uniref:peptidoglycan editing factor PgeF n=1 Tax=Alteriqipengyuania lutimaris TaxID=1538146 RepID=UPI001CFDC673|nr:peptidoglycan editing factor PgeF [Alteriqipengyuania lutimaris]
MADGGPVPIRAAALEGVPHGFFGRQGGVSTGEVAGLQVGFGAGDDPEFVAENRRRVIAAVLPGAGLAMPFQVHSPDVAVVSAPVEGDDRPRVDALVSATPGLLIGVVTADCAPVLLADRQAGVVAAAHAGWRGAKEGVLANTVAEMERLGADRSRIGAAIGPTIAQPSYEVDAGFRDAFLADDPATDRFFASGKPGHFQFDLPGFVAAQLAAAGVGKVENLGLDTYADPARFYSFRRATHRGEATYGRQGAFIGLG